MGQVGAVVAEGERGVRVKNAATRKYLTKDWLWYWPPGEMTERLAAYANAHGLPSSWPYYSLDGERPVTAAEWDALRYHWRHAHGVTNVWSRRPLHDEERLKGTLRRAAPRVHNPTAASSAHLNQKPLEFMEPPDHGGNRTRRRGMGTVRRAVLGVGRGRHAGPPRLRGGNRPGVRRPRRRAATAYQRFRHQRFPASPRSGDQRFRRPPETSAPVIAVAGEPVALARRPRDRAGGGTWRSRSGRLRSGEILRHLRAVGMRGMMARAGLTELACRAGHRGKWPGGQAAMG